MLVAETYFELMGNAAHWEFELTLEALTFVAGAVFAKIVHPLQRHDARHHGRHNDVSAVVSAGSFNVYAETADQITRRMEGAA